MDTMASRQLLQIMVENAPLAMAMFDHDMQYIVANANWVKEFRLEGQKVIGKSQFDVFPGLHESWRNIYNSCLNGQVERCEEDVFQRTDGTRDWVRWEVRPWMTAEMEVGGLLICCQIVTPLKEFEQQLQFESAFARTLLGPRSLVMVVDREGSIVRCSEGAQALVGESPPEPGSSFLRCFPPVLGTEPEALLKEVFATSASLDQPRVVTTQQAGGGGEIAWQVLPSGEATDAQAALLVGVEVPASGAKLIPQPSPASPTVNLGAQAALARLSGAAGGSSPQADANQEVIELQKDNAALVGEVKELRKQCGRAAKELRAAKDEREELTKVRETDATEIGKLQLQLESKQEQFAKMSGANQELDSLNKERDKLAADCERLETRVTELQSRQRTESDDFAKERTGLLDQLKVGRSSLRDLEDDLKTAELALGDVETLTLEIEDLRERLGASEGTSKKYHESRRLLEEKDADIARLSKELESLREQLKVKDQQLEEARSEEQERATLERRVVKLGEEKDALASQKEALAGEKEALVTARDTLVSEKDLLASARDTLATEKNALATEKEALSSKNEELSVRLEKADGAASDRARDFEAANAGLQLEISALRKQLDAKEAEANRLVDAEGELSVLNASLKTASVERGSLLEQLSLLEVKVGAEGAEKARQQEELEALKQERQEMQESLSNLQGQTKEGEEFSEQLRIKLDETETALALANQAEIAKQGELHELLATAQNEREQLQAELNQVQDAEQEELAALTARLAEAESERALLGLVPEHTPFGLVLLAAGGEVIYRNPPFAGLLGHDAEPGSTFDDLLRAGSPDPEHTEKVLDEWKEKIWRKQATRTFSLASQEGLIKDIEFRPTLLEDGQLLVSARDVTEQLRGEEALRASETRFRSLFQDAPVGVALVDGTGEIFDINPALEGLLGCRRLEMRRAALADFIHADGMDAYKTASGSVAGGESICEEVEVVLLQADGGELPTRLSIGAVRSKSGELLFTTVFFDPTKPAATAVNGLQLGGDPGRDTYQRMRSSLRIISSLINLQISSVPAASAREALTASEGRVRAIGLLYEHLETAEDRSGVAFGQYLQRLTDRLVDAVPAPSNVTVTVSSESIRLPVDRAVILGLVANELISNALIHAYPEDGFSGLGNVLVSMTSRETEGVETIQLTVVDNGIGLPNAFDPKNTSGFGLSIAGTLCEQLGGSLEWKALEQGTEFGLGFASDAAH